MKMLKGKALHNKVTNIIYQSRQLFEDHVYLTVKNIYTLENRGNIDFGGSEYKPGKIVAVMPAMQANEQQKKKENKKEKEYPWWHCQAGQYLMEYNEQLQLSSGLYVFLTPASMILRNNAYHPQLFYSLSEENNDNYRFVPLTVGAPGINIKKNARVSCLYMYHFREDFFPPS